MLKSLLSILLFISVLSVEGLSRERFTVDVVLKDQLGTSRLKGEFTFFQSLSRLFVPIYFIKSRRTYLELNSLDPYPSSEGREFRCRLLSSTWSKL